MGDLLFLPDQASTFSRQVDTIYLVLIGLSTIFTVPIVLLIVYFAIKYRRGSKADRSRSHVSQKLEYAWMAGLFFLALPVFIWSASVYFDMFRPPPEGMEIFVVGRQWMWKFQHPTGPREINQLHVPVGRVIKLTMTSEDVIHSFYVPAFRLKHDVIPGRYTTIWFEATKTGTYHLFCAEYCGTEHSEMIGQVTVMEPADYQAWLTNGSQAEPGAPQTSASMADAGQQLFQRAGCASCHTADGNGPGPPLAGVFGSQVQLESGEIVVADENYIRESIVNPNAKIVHGRQPIMPSFQGQLSEEQILQLIAYIKSLGSQGVPGGTGGTTIPGGTTTPGGTAVPGATSGTSVPSQPAATSAP